MATVILNFGKYHGRSTEEVWKLDRDYCLWVIRTESENPNFNRAKYDFMQFAHVEMLRKKFNEEQAREEQMHRARHSQQRQSYYDEFDGNFFQRGSNFNDIWQRYEQMRRTAKPNSGNQKPPPSPPPRSPPYTSPQHWTTVLGVNVNDPVDTIKKAYRTLASKHHPDKGGDTAKMQSINAAYQAAMRGR